MQKADKIRLKFYLSDSDIYQYYYKDFNIDRKVSSPFRKDPVPSLKFYEKDGNIYWRDFGLGDQKGNDPISFVMQLFDISDIEACNLIWEEIIEGNNIPKNKRKAVSSKKDFIVTYRDLVPFELAYWGKAQVAIGLLDFFKIKAVDKAYINDILLFESIPDDPAFYYDFGPDTFKTYRPLVKNKSKKFRGKNNGTILEGWEQLPETGNHLIITKSLKDVVILRNMGILATAPSGEGSLNVIRNNIKEINGRFKRVLILFDYDEAGIKNSNILHSETTWQQIYIDKEKDCYDNVVTLNSYFYLKEFFKNLNIKRYGDRY